MMMSNFTEIECTGCGVTLRPNRRTMRAIGGLGAAIGATAGLAAMRLFGLGAVIAILLVAYIAACIATVIWTKFEIIEPD